MRIAYVTSYDPNDRSNWSGLGHAIMESLKGQGLNVTPMGHLADHFYQAGRIKRRIYRLFHRSYDFQRSGIVGHDYARQVRKRLDANDFDIVFSPGSIPISRLDCRQPVVIWADATWDCYASHYGADPPWCAETIRAGHDTDRRAYDRSHLLIFASQWAADSAIKDYGADPKKVRVISFGANFAAQIDRDRVLRSISERPVDRCKLITIGVDWHRKGIQRAIELAATLNEAGLSAELTVVGCSPPTGSNVPDFVHVAGFIDKRDARGESRLSALLMQSHFHVLFPLAEAFGVVFAEANAHAVPNITYDIGGIASAVVDDKGGRRFSPRQPIADIAAYIRQYFSDRDRYAALARAARQQYDERLNWRTSGAAVKRELGALMASR
jgi:glycosyltransferase involved in cell wall biosynthesis